MKKLPIAYASREITQDNLTSVDKQDNFFTIEKIKMSCDEIAFQLSKNDGIHLEEAKVIIKIQMDNYLKIFKNKKKYVLKSNRFVRFLNNPFEIIKIRAFKYLWHFNFYPYFRTNRLETQYLKKTIRNFQLDGSSILRSREQTFNNTNS